MWLTIAVCIVTGGLLHGAHGEFDGKKLKMAILKDYQRGVRPVANHTHTTPLKMGMDFRQIIDLDEKHQILSSNVWMRKYWKDEALTWDPDEYNGMKYINLPSTEIWLPDVVLTNSAGKNHDQPQNNVIISYNGEVTWLVTRMYFSACYINTYFFPFDEQNCTLTFASWTHSGFEIDLIQEPEPPSKSYYVNNDEWKLIDIYVRRDVVYYECCPEPYPEVTYTIRIQRRALFYVTNLLAPCCLLSFLVIFGFYLPSDSGERVGLGITILLSYSVFLLMVSEWMPPTSRTVPLIVVYYSVTMLLVTLATAMTIAVLNIHHCAAHTTPVPHVIRFLVLRLLARLVCMNSVSSHWEEEHHHPWNIERTINMFTMNTLDNGHGTDTESVAKNKSKPPGNSPGENGLYASLLMSMREIHKEIRTINARFQRTDIQTGIEDEWKKVAKVIDRFLMLLFAVATCLTSVCLFSQVPHFNL
ncbi:neuronal acetylcholine receptor subunit alpha-9-like [Branchiostoma floridae]|uniref:Neuronal acetylcholine receptor subunit alpha-9-like n=2 Tax=Branchiostoma floridae TaxID=7739 RepID=A0A9J7K812_BRAFL|nr:neuronal acetylcholine receptor subunit alpha-9-like [Branchiostoma floridae]